MGQKAEVARGPSAVKSQLMNSVSTAEVLETHGGNLGIGDGLLGQLLVAKV